MTHNLIGVDKKIERAEKHILDLQDARKRFIDTDPYPTGGQRNPETRCPEYRVLSVRAIDSDIAAIAGDVIQNLRSALDHLAYQLVIVGTRKPGPFTHVYYPIAKSATDYETEKLRKTKGMRQDAIDAIDATKPYRGGNDTLWQLHELNLVDKHRLLLSAGAYFQSMDAMVDILRNLEKQVGHPIPKIQYPISPMIKRFPLEVGDVLYIADPRDEVNDNHQFNFEIAFKESGIVWGEPVIPKLQEMVDMVNGIVRAFREARALWI